MSSRKTEKLIFLQEIFFGWWAIKLKAHPEHWHVTALRRAMEDLRAWVVESRRAGMSWSLAGNSAVGEECSELSEELSELDVSCSGFRL